MPPSFCFARSRRTFFKFYSQRNVTNACNAANVPPFVFHKDYSIPWPKNHRFPMWKYRALANHLIQEGMVPSLEDYLAPTMEATDEHVLLAHEAQYYFDFVQNRLDATLLRRSGFAQREDHNMLVQQWRLGIAGTVLASRVAIERGLACNLWGGTHHAHRSWGSGYNILNDLAVAAKFVVEHGLARRVCIVDLDVHQGDGTAEICSGDDRIFTFSMHCADNFPFGFKGLPYLGKDRSNLDIALPAGTGDSGFMAALEEHLPKVLAFDPDLILYDAGVDVHEADDLGHFRLTDEGIKARDQYVLAECVEKRGFPVAIVIGGGYARIHETLTKRHAITCRTMHDLWTRLLVQKCISLLQVWT